MTEEKADSRQISEIMSGRESRRRNPVADKAVLVVEDEAPQRDVLTRVFTAAGFEVKCVTNGLEAFEALHAHDYHAILSDLRMPEQSGFTFFEQLEELFPHMASRVIFMSAFAHDPEVQSYLERTGQPFFQKPYQLKELIRTVNEMTEKPLYR